MYKEIYKKIKKHKNIIIVRHTGADPDALGSQVALKDIIQNTFKDKNVYAAGTISSKFKSIGSTDIIPEEAYNDSLVIVLDTPISRRMDGVSFEKLTDSIKIDHHPFEEKFCNLEWIDDNISSCSEMVLDLCYKTKLELTKYSAERLLVGIISDTNRFLYSYSTTNTMRMVADLIDKYDIDKNEIYEKVYMRDISELRLQGYISQNMIITENNVGYICIKDETIKEFKVDAASAGNMVNNFTYVNELLVWATFSEDVKANTIRVSIRSRGPAINTIANQYNGGGHKYASGIRLENFDLVEEIISKLDEACKEYKGNNE
jgi:phosphoesterase RecJ-like protein